MRIFGTWSRYIVDHRYYGAAALVESYVEFLKFYVWDKFKAIFYSSYSKFLAAIEGKIDLSNDPEIVKYISTTSTEGRLRPSLNVDIVSIEPDEQVTPFFFNFANFSAAFERVMNIDDAIIINDRYVLIPQMMYVKINLECNVVFDSWYEKVDFEIALLQAHGGINRVFTPYKVEVVVPLNGYLEQDLNLNPSTPINVSYINRFADKRRLNNVVYRFIFPTGRESFHLTHFSFPKVTLTSLNDSSEKYGGERHPDFRTNFSVTIEDYIMSSYIVINTSILEGVTLSLTDATNTNPIFNSILLALYNFFRNLFSYLNLPFSMEIFVMLLHYLMNAYNFQTLEELLQFLANIFLSNDLDAIYNLLDVIRIILLTHFGIDVPFILLYQIFMDVVLGGDLFTTGLIPPLYFIVPNVNMVFLPISGSCSGIPADRLRFIVHEVNNFVPPNSELRIPPSVWRITPTARFITVTNSYTSHFLDHNTQEIVIRGPILKGFRFVIVVQI